MIAQPPPYESADVGASEEADGGAGSDSGVIAAPIILPSARPAEGGAFSTSDACETCHSNASTANAMRDRVGRDIAPFDLWRSTMMANAARDPLFRAVMSAEIAATPSARAEIEAKCLSCHAPMATRTAQTLEMGELYQDSPKAQLALDGVSCTVCHLIRPDGLGTEESFSGRFTTGTREIFGPHDDLFSMPMQRHTGYVPTMGTHMGSSELCGSCHTLFTDALTPEGVKVGVRLPEQTPFLEWRNSSYSQNGASCQSCHAPKVDQDGQTIRTAIARNPMGRDFPPVYERSPYSRHVFVGANTLVPAMLRDNAQELNSPAPAGAFDRTIDEARGQLSRAARLQGELQRRGDDLEVTLDIENLTGHKLPTAHPIRRMWLHVEVTNAEGAVVFVSGASDDQNRLLGAGGVPLAFEMPDGPISPHANRIESADAVAVYESVMGTPGGDPTTTLLRGSQYLKDNRILPHGYDLAHPDAVYTRPVGIGDDSDFSAGRDRVTYVVPAPGAAGPYRVVATLKYVSLSPRWLAELTRYETPETQALARYYAALDRRPEPMASISLSE